MKLGVVVCWYAVRVGRSTYCNDMYVTYLVSIVRFESASILYSQDFLLKFIVELCSCSFLSEIKGNHHSCLHSTDHTKGK